MSKTFNVSIREVHVLTMVVDADTEEEAIALAHDGKGEELMVEYSHTLGKGETTLEEVQSTDTERELRRILRDGEDD